MQLTPASTARRAYRTSPETFLPRTIFGVDFSGAKEAGKNVWLAETQVVGNRLRLTELQSLESLAGTSAREPALAHLVQLIRGSDRALWAMDFPFALPLEVFPPKTSWAAQLAWVRSWDSEAYGLGLECVRRARLLGDAMHIRRQTDTEARTPFDCYHYRIIYH